MYKLSDIKPGDRIKVSVWAGEAPVMGTVDYTEKDIKNGLPGVNYTADNGGEYWCYLDQVLYHESKKIAPEKSVSETKKTGGIKDKVAVIISANKSKTKKEIVAIIMQEMGVKENTANQYYYKSKG